MKLIPKISVIIPTHRPAMYLRECLDSLKSQTCDPSLFETIIILNTDECLEFLVAREVVRDSGLFVNMISTSIRGVSNARNKGLDVARGEYIVFIDDDDVVSDSYLEGLLRVACRSCIGVSNFKCFDSVITENWDDYLGLEYKKLSSRRDIRLVTGSRFFSNVCGKIIPKKLVGLRRFNLKLSHGEDGLFMASLFSQVTKLYFSSDDVIYFRRVRIDSVSRLLATPFVISRRSAKLFLEYFRLHFTEGIFRNKRFFLNRYSAVVKSYLLALCRSVIC